MESPKKYIAIPFDAKSTESKVYEVPSSDSNTQEQRTEKNSSGSYNSEKAFEECIIYFVHLKHENNQGYVGQTNRSLNDRRAEHERNANMGHPGQFYEALRNEGIKNWNWTILEFCTVEEAYKRERFFIQKLNSSSIEILNTVYNRKKKIKSQTTEKNHNNKSITASLAARKAWQNADSRKWMQLAGKLKPVMNLEKQVKYRSALEASRNELDSLPTIKKSCDAGRRTPHNNIYAWLDIDGNPILTELHKKGGLPRTKRVKHLETGKIFSNIKDAAQAYGINYNNIQNVCVGSQKTTGKGLVFCYVDDEDNDVLTQIHKEYQNEQSENKYKYYAIYPLETDYKTPLAIGKTLKELCDILGLSPSHALEVCKGNRQHDKGYRFTFYDFKEKKPLLFENHKTKLKKVIRNVKCLDDNLEFSNLSEAGKHYGLLSDQIRQCCIGKLKSTGRGRVQRRFAYVDKNGNPILTPKHEESFSWLGTRVFCPELGKTFQSVAEFCRETGVPQKTARKHLKNPETSLMGLTLIKTGNRHQRR